MPVSLRWTIDKRMRENQNVGITGSLEGPSPRKKISRGLPGKKIKRPRRGKKN